MLFGILIIVIILALIARLGGKAGNKVLFLIALVLLAMFSGFRDAFLYPDITNYYDFFRGQESFVTDNFGYGYTFLNKLFSKFSFQSFLFFISVIVIYCNSRIIKQYSPYIWLSLILFVLIGYYPSFFILRQSLAIAFSLLSVPFIIRRKPIHFLLFTLIAVSQHISAIIVVPIYFLYGLKYSKMNMLLVLIGSLILIGSFSLIGGYVNQFSSYYGNYFGMENEESGWKRALMGVFILGVYIYTLKTKMYEEGMNRIVFYYMVFNVIICVAAMNVFGMHRIREFFFLADYIGIPIIIKEAKNFKISKRLLVLLSVLVYIILLYISFNNFVMGENMNNSYQFFWNNRIN